MSLLIREKGGGAGEGGHTALPSSNKNACGSCSFDSVVDEEPTTTHSVCGSPFLLLFEFVDRFGVLALKWAVTSVSSVKCVLLQQQQQQQQLFFKLIFDL